MVCSDLGKQCLHDGAQRGEVVIDHLRLHHDHHQSLWEDVAFGSVLADRPESSTKLVPDHRVAHGPRNRIGHLTGFGSAAWIVNSNFPRERGKSNRHGVAPIGPTSSPKNGKLSPGTNTPNDWGANTVRRKDGCGPSGDGSSRWPGRRDRPCDGESHDGAHDDGHWVGRFSSRCASSASKVRVGPGCSAMCGRATTRSGMRYRHCVPRTGNRRRPCPEPATSDGSSHARHPRTGKQTVGRSWWILPVVGLTRSGTPPSLRLPHNNLRKAWGQISATTFEVLNGPIRLHRIPIRLRMGRTSTFPPAGRQEQRRPNTQAGWK